MFGNYRVCVCVFARVRACMRVLTLSSECLMHELLLCNPVALPLS